MSSEEMNQLHSNGVHVLLVDYDTTSLSKSTLVLRQASFEVTSTKVQQVALTLLQEHRRHFNMLIVSGENQDMDCHSFIQRIRIIQEDLPIIVVISSLEGDQGLKTLFDGGCYVIRKPVAESTIWGVWKKHEMRTGLVTRRQVHMGNGQQVIEESEEGGNGSVAQAEYAPFDPKGKALERNENRKLKRNKLDEDEEQEVARKKGKSIAEPSKMDETETTKEMRPAFDPHQHKVLMKALSYGPARQMNMDRFLPTMGQQQLPTIFERYGRARAPWTQYLNERFEKAMARNIVPGYGVQQPHLHQMISKKLPPSWVSPANWRARLNSEYLNSGTNEAVRCIPLSGLSNLNPYGASTSINGGMSVARYEMSMNPNVVNFNGVGSTIPNGMDQNMNQVRTQTNPIVIDGFKNGAIPNMPNGMDQNMNQVRTQTNPILLDGLNNGSIPTMPNGMDQSMNQVRTQLNPKVLDGFNNGAQDGMRFGSYGYDNSLLSVVYPEKGNTQIEKQLNESIGYGQSFDNRFEYPITNLDSLPGVEGNFFQGTNNVVSTDSQTADAYNVNQEDVREENFATWQVLGTTQTNQFETLVNESSKQGSKGENRAENLNSSFDEFAELFSFLENDGDDGRTNPGTEKANEVAGDSYFDIESFELSCGDRQI